MNRRAFLICLVTLFSLEMVTTAEPRIESTYGSRAKNLPLPVPLEKMPAVTRDAITKVFKDPTITALAPVEEFTAHSDMYQWLLDHPDRTARAWKKLGITAIEISPTKDGRFVWKDDNGSEMVWQTVARGPAGRIWYADGKVKPGPLMPMVPVTAVAVLNHAEKPREKGDTRISHQVEVFLHTDHRAANMVTRMMGDQAPKMAQQGAEQLLMFFSGIARYSHEKPEKAAGLLNEKSR